MQGSTKEALLAQTFVDLVDTLVDDFDVVDLLTLVADRCVEVLDITAAGLMLVAPEGDLRVVAFSSEEVRVVELFELQAEEGPCLDSFRSGQPIVNQDLEKVDGRWPNFAPVAIAAGYRSVHAMPMRLRGAVIGALNLFRAEVGDLGEFDLLAAQALADVATIAILHHRAASEAQIGERAADTGPQQPHRHRAGQGCPGRASPGSTWTRPSPGCESTPVTTISALSTSPTAWSRAR